MTMAASHERHRDFLRRAPRDSQDSFTSSPLSGSQSAMSAALCGSFSTCHNVFVPNPSARIRGRWRLRLRRCRLPSRTPISFLHLERRARWRERTGQLPRRQQRKRIYSCFVPLCFPFGHVGCSRVLNWSQLCKRRMRAPRVPECFGWFPFAIRCALLCAPEGNPWCIRRCQPSS